MQVTIRQREAGVPESVEDLMRSLLYGHGLPRPKSVPDVNAIQAFCEQVGITVDVAIVPVAGSMGGGTVGLTAASELTEPWVVRVDDQLLDDHLVDSTFGDNPSFSATLRHELGHVLLLSTQMRQRGISAMQITAEHARRANAYRTFDDYTNDPDEAGADRFSLAYPNVRLSVR